MRRAVSAFLPPVFCALVAAGSAAPAWAAAAESAGEADPLSRELTPFGQAVLAEPAKTKKARYAESVGEIEPLADKIDGLSSGLPEAVRARYAGPLTTLRVTDKADSDARDIEISAEVADALYSFASKPLVAIAYFEIFEKMPASEGMKGFWKRVDTAFEAVGRWRGRTDEPEGRRMVLGYALAWVRFGLIKAVDDDPSSTAWVEPWVKLERLRSTLLKDEDERLREFVSRFAPEPPKAGWKTFRTADLAIHEDYVGWGGQRKEIAERVWDLCAKIERREDAELREWGRKFGRKHRSMGLGRSEAQALRDVRQKVFEDRMFTLWGGLYRRVFEESWPGIKEWLDFHIWPVRIHWPDYSAFYPGVFLKRAGELAKAEEWWRADEVYRFLLQHVPEGDPLRQRLVEEARPVRKRASEAGKMLLLRTAGKLLADGEIARAPRELAVEAAMHSTRGEGARKWKLILAGVGFIFVVGGVGLLYRRWSREQEALRLAEEEAAAEPEPSAAAGEVSGPELDIVPEELPPPPAVLKLPERLLESGMVSADAALPPADVEGYKAFLQGKWDKKPADLPFPEIAEDMAALPKLFGKRSPEAWDRFLSERRHRADRWSMTEYAEALRQAILGTVPFAWAASLYGEIRGNVPPSVSAELHYWFALYCEAMGCQDSALTVYRELDRTDTRFRESAAHLARLEEWLKDKTEALEDAFQAAQAGGSGDDGLAAKVEKALAAGAAARAFYLVLNKAETGPWSKARLTACLSVHLRLVEKEWPDELYKKMMECLPAAEAQDLYYEWALHCEKKGLLERAKALLEALGGRAAVFRDVAERLRQLESISDEESGRITRYAKSRLERAAAGKGKDAPEASLGLVGGKFDLLEPLGQGGMGFVYKARDNKLGRTVAVKKMQGQISRDPELARYFLAEARLVAAMEHPYIVGIHEIVEEKDAIYLVLNYVDGDTLEELLMRHKTVPARETCRILGFVSEALIYAHAHDVIHRDIKPANIMKDRFGYVKVMDFGIARLAVERATRSAAQDTCVSGTPLYMAPEQHDGTSTKRSDAYSLGVTGYEMLTGVPPFTGRDIVSRKRSGSYTALGPDVPKLLGELIAHCLSPDPAKRPDMTTVHKALAKGVGT